MGIAFGTEGWRAIIADDFTVENVQRVTQAIADHVRAQRTAASARWVAVGYDTRFLSDRFARAVCEVLAGNRIRSVLSRGPVPTCAVSRFVVARGFDLGIMITASHNPAHYNGIKVKEAYGGSASLKTVASIERRIGRAPVRMIAWEAAAQAGLIEERDLLPTFVRGLRAFVDLQAIRRRPFRVVVDAMHGAGNRLIEQLLAGGRCRVATIHARPDPLFGGHAPEPIPGHLAELRCFVRRARADVGIANDGDADRIGVVAPGGRWVTPGQVMCLLLEHLVTRRLATGAVVKTVSNTMMLNRMTDALGLRLLEVPVGFKHIAKLMLEDHVLIGGEESGGIGVTAYLPERDGIANGLLLLEAMAMRGRSLTAMLAELERRYGHWDYGRRDLHLTRAVVERLFARLRRAPPDVMAGVPVVRVNTLDGVKLIGRDESWLLFRRSGTEPVVRIYAETPTSSRLPRLLAFGVDLTARA